MSVCKYLLRHGKCELSEAVSPKHNTMFRDNCIMKRNTLIYFILLNCYESRFEGSQLI